MICGNDEPPMTFDSLTSHEPNSSSDIMGPVTWGTYGIVYPRHSMGLVYLPISWGGFGGQCRHIWQSHGVSGYSVLEPLLDHPKSLFCFFW